MPRGFHALLAGTRMALNAILVAQRIMTMLAFAALLSIAMTAILHAYRQLAITDLPDFLFTYFWMATIASGALAGAVSGLRRRLDNGRTALWMDLTLKTPELFQAALRCSGDETGHSPAFGEAVMDRVEILCGKTARLPAPWKILAQRASIAMLAVLASWFFAGLAPAASSQSVSTPATESAQASESIVDRLFSAGSSSPEELAHSLFPESSGMAEQASTAIREGRLDEIKNLLRRADLDLVEKIKRSVSDAERKRLREERDRLADIVRAMEDQDVKEDDAQQEDPSDSSNGMYGTLPGDGSQDPGTLPGRNRMAKPEDEEAPAEGSGDQKKPRRNNPEATDESPQGGGPSGNESGGSQKAIPDIGAQQGDTSEGTQGKANAAPGSSLSSPRNWGPIAPRASGPEAFIRPDENAPYFMYILPGMTPQTRPADIIANARRTAEAALSRNSVPLDYEDFVAAYFLELMREP